MDIAVLQTIVVVLGVCALGISGYHAYKMYHYRKGIGQVLFWMLFGEASSILVAVFFALASLYDLYDGLGPHFFAGLRIYLFGIASFTTLNLMVYMQSRIHRLEEDYEENPTHNERRTKD